MILSIPKSSGDLAENWIRTTNFSRRFSKLRRAKHSRKSLAVLWIIENLNLGLKPIRNHDWMNVFEKNVWMYSKHSAREYVSGAEEVGVLFFQRSGVFGYANRISAPNWGHMLYTRL